jgi:uncharacterized protein involved in exopolysaccharide biosynthesis
MEQDLSVISHNRNVVSSPTLRDLLAVAFRRRRLMGVSFLGILLGAILVAVLEPSRYQAEMKILVKQGRVDPVVTPDASIQPQLLPEITEEELNSEAELFKSRDLLEKVVLTCNLERSSNSIWARIFPSGLRGSSKPETSAAIARAASALSKALQVEVVKKTNLITVTYESTNPQLAAQVLTAVANFYVEKHLAVHRPPGALDFFERASERYRTELATAERHLVDFSQGTSIVSAQLEKEIAVQKMAEFDTTLKQTQAAILETEQRIGALEKQASTLPARTVTQDRSADDAMLLSQLGSNLLTLELKRADLLAKFQPSYRPVQEVNGQIAQVRAAIALAEKSPLHDQTTDRDPTYEWVRGELAKAKAELSGLQARAEATALAVRSYQENARTLEQKQIVQDDLQRTVKTTEENYLLYLRKEEEARISDALDRGKILNVAIAEPATVPALPSNSRPLTALAGLLLAGLISLGLGFGSEYLDPTFRTPDEVTALLDVPVLAVLPRNNGKESSVPARTQPGGP